jgi:hypothetical protein
MARQAEFLRGDHRALRLPSSPSLDLGLLPTPRIFLLIFIILKCMLLSAEKHEMAENRTETRRAGRPKGRIKKQLSITVTEETWNAACEKWQGKGSHLIDTLLHIYATGRNPER